MLDTRQYCWGTEMRKVTVPKGLREFSLKRWTVHWGKFGEAEKRKGFP